MEQLQQLKIEQDSSLNQLYFIFMVIFTFLQLYHGNIIMNAKLSIMKSSIIVLLSILIPLSTAEVDCTVSVILSFQECVNLCINKYGINPDTQRLFYNRFTGMCEKAVTCTTTPFRVYENRCLKDFESFKVGELNVAVPEFYTVVYTVTVHGNPLALNQSKICYPGFFSSHRREVLGVQVFREYACDVPVGTDPANYPTSHGEYFFYRLDIQLQLAALDMDCPQQSFFNAGYSFLLMVETLFFLSCCHYNMFQLKKKISKIST